MIEMLLNRLFEPRYPRRYIGRHRATTMLQLGWISRRTRGAAV